MHNHIDSSGVFECPLGSACKLPNAGEQFDAMLEALEAFLRAPSIGSNGPGSVTIEVQTFNLKAAQAAIAIAKGQRRD
jgi:hypothetical protein